MGRRSAVLKVLIADREIEVNVTHFYPGRPAKVFGPPEGCYPDEPWEIEWEFDDSNMDDAEFVFEAIENNRDWQESIEEQLYDQLTSRD